MFQIKQRQKLSKSFVYNIKYTCIETDAELKDPSLFYI